MDSEFGDDLRKILNFHLEISGRVVSRENSKLEFKESFNWGSKDKYAKAIVAFANNIGGSLVFGVKNSPRDVLGLQSTSFQEMDEAKITEYLNGSFSPEIDFRKFTVQVQGKTLGFLQVYPCKNKPVICIRNDGEVKEGEIYYRYNARSEKIKFPELRGILEEIKEKERSTWMGLFEKIAKVGPANAAVLDLINGEIEGRGGSLLIDRKLIPKLKFIKEGKFQEKGAPTLKLIGDVMPITVEPMTKTDIAEVKYRLTDDPTAQPIRLEEEDILKKFPYDYYALSRVLRERYLDFKMDNRYHKLRKRMKKDKNLCNQRLLDPRNPKGAKKDFYSQEMLKKFDKHYTLRKKAESVVNLKKAPPLVGLSPA